MPFARRTWPPPLLAGRDVVGLAQTGTGKTAAFALPILSRLDVRQKSPQALVLAPTRELALQVCEAFEKYAAHLKGVHVLPVYGGQAYGVQLSALRRGVHIVFEVFLRFLLPKAESVRTPVWEGMSVGDEYLA